MRRIIGVGLVVLAIMLSSGPITTAQDGSTGAAGGTTTIHVVQRDENLFRIAMKYGTTVEAISEANGITDARYISVGQRLLIPNARIDTPGAVVTHVVQPGDSLETLVHTYRTTIDSLASANHLTNPARLYIGQELTISQGADGSAPPTARQVHQVAAGENLARIALAAGVSLNDLLRANDLTTAVPIFDGQRLWIPGETAPGSLIDLPLPFTAVALKPTPAVQGQTIGIHVTTDGPATLSGDFMGYPIQTVTHDANQHDALFGIHPFTEPGIYPLNLIVTSPDGAQSALALRVRVDSGGYGSETISLDAAQANLLQNDVTEPEWQRIATVMSGFTAQRYFDGLMGLPSTGAITSQFGTRRDYNGGSLNTFHSGTDFGGGPGSPVLAPAAGVVVLTETMPVRGNATVIDHGWGVFTGYWHQTEILVAVGDVVQAGQKIGTIGSTGRSTGPHLHWEMWVGGNQVNPMQWVQQSFP